MTFQVRRLIALGLACLPFAAISQGAAWPARPIRVVVPFAAGAATDTVARVVMEQVSRQLGQPIIIDNKPGAGGTIGASMVAHAEPDGYTLMVHSNSQTVTPWTYRNLNFDPMKDLVGVTPLVSVPMVLVTAPAKGVRTLGNLVAAARAKPGAMNYASAGTGGVTHLGAERLRMAAGFIATHIPTKSSGEALTEVMTERVDFYYSPIGLAAPFVKQGKLVALGVSSVRRSSALPDVPTTVEAGLPNSEYEVWIGMFAPARTPQAILDRLNAETVKALQSPELRERFANLVMEPMAMSLADFSNFLKRDFELNGELVKAAGIQPN